MVVGLLGNKSSDSNRFTLVTPKSENDVRLQATLGNQNPIGLPVGVVSTKKMANSSLNFKKVVKSAEKAKESFVFNYKTEEKIIFQNRQI